MGRLDQQADNRSNRSTWPTIGDSSSKAWTRRIAAVSASSMVRQWAVRGYLDAVKAAAAAPFIRSTPAFWRRRRLHAQNTSTFIQCDPPRPG